MEFLKRKGNNFMIDVWPPSHNNFSLEISRHKHIFEWYTEEQKISFQLKSSLRVIN